MATTLTPQIVYLNVSLTLVPAPSQLQRSGAIISEGGTTLTPGSYQYAGNLSQLQALLDEYGNSAELELMGETFFGQGNDVGLYVLELGEQGTPADGVTALKNWIAANQSVFYAYLLPSAWDNATGLQTLIGNYSNTTALTYFFPTASVADVAAYQPNKGAFVTVPEPTSTDTQFQAAVAFYNWLANNPSATNQLAPMAYRYAYGVTPWPDNSADVDTILTDFGNYVGTGAQGGIDANILYQGRLSSGAQASAWYGLDWFQIQVRQALTAAIIAGSNSNPPLLYNQTGINKLLAVIQGVLDNAIAFGCLEDGSVSATDFATYIAQNPSDYANGIYNGFSATVTGQNGFLTITFNINAVQIA